jgi:hypothetical protein
MPLRLGEIVKHGRHARLLTLRHLADQVMKDDGTPISPQYLLDIEVHHPARAPHDPDSLAPVWSKNSCSLSLVVCEQSAKPFTTLYRAAIPGCWAR